ncbi:MAG: metal-dependent hydrolase [Candidatus Heimdallarchaeota archaeon]|nr:MAG: metal-dependent hydrolase [Candidatus Heimdallarchaeota archaeon]
MEPIAHLEWTLGIGLICLTIWNTSIDALGLFLLCIGSVFPDIFDWALFRGERFIRGHRELSHTIFFIFGLIVISWVFPAFSLLTLGSFLHIMEDIVSGGNPVFLFSPITHRGSILIISKEQSIKIGAWFRKVIKESYIGSENIGDELSWLWFLTILGTWILMIGIFVYFSIML